MCVKYRVAVQLWCSFLARVVKYTRVCFFCTTAKSFFWDGRQSTAHWLVEGEVRQLLTILEHTLLCTSSVVFGVLQDFSSATGGEIRDAGISLYQLHVEGLQDK